jgi:hypothetical protein
MFVTYFLPTLTCLLIIFALFCLVRLCVIKGDEAVQQARFVSFSIGLLMVGFPLYSHIAALEVGDYFIYYWAVPLIFFGAVISLNALRGGLKNKIFGWGWWCIGIAFTLEYLLLQYGSHSVYDLLQPSLQTILAKCLIFLLSALAFFCFLHYLLFGTPGTSHEKLGRVIALLVPVLGSLASLLQAAGTFADVLKTFLK